MNVVIGADHNGFTGKAYLKQYVVGIDDPIAWIDVGAFDDERSDYPIFAELAVKALLQGEAERGVLLCGSGIGMAIVANRFPGIYAGVAWNDDVARLSHEDDKTNMLVIPSDFVSHELSASMVNAWLSAVFKGDRHQKRIDMIDEITEKTPS